MAVCPQALTTDLTQLPDPTRPSLLVAPTQSRSDPAPSVYRLSAIRISPQARAAVINGQAVTLGDSVGTLSVVAIESDAVTLESSTGKIRVPLIDVQVKRAREVE